jgi:ribosome-associated protein
VKKDDNPPDVKSKSQIKREMLALQKLGEKLVDLSPAQIEKIPLNQLLIDAIAEARLIRSREGKRRQMQYIGRLMRKIDAGPVEAAIEKIELKSREGKAAFHKIERWRDRLIAEDDTAIEDLLGQFPDIDRQHLRQLVRNAKKLKPGASTELFKYLWKLM